MIATSPEPISHALRWTQALAWEDMRRVASEGAHPGVRLDDREYIVGIDHPFYTTYFNQRFVTTDGWDAEWPVARDWAASCATRPLAVAVGRQDEAAEQEVFDAGLRRGPMLAIWRATTQPFTPSVTVRRLNAETAGDYLKTLQSDVPEECRALYRKLAGRDRWFLFVADVDGEVAGGAAMYCDGESAYLGWARTRPEFRGRGAQRALIEARLSHAHELGMREALAVTVVPHADPEIIASFENPSSRNAIRCGFALAGFDQIWLPAGSIDAVLAALEASPDH